MTTTSGMKRGGFYDDHSEYQRRVAASGEDLIRGDDFFSRLQQRFAADPERDAFEDWTVTMVAARR